MAEIILNSKYAPGIATYGTQGREGKKGDNGKSIFFIPYELYDENQVPINTQNLYNDYISVNKIIGVDSSLSYKYEYGDSFITPTAKVYTYNIDNDKNYNFVHIGTVNALKQNEEYFADSSDFIYNKEYKKLLFTNQNLENEKNIEEEIKKYKSILNIASYKENNNTNDEINLLSLIAINNNAIDELNFSCDPSNNIFYINTNNKPILFDSIYSKLNNSLEPKSDYFPIVCDINLFDFLTFIISEDTKTCTIKLLEPKIKEQFILILSYNDINKPLQNLILNDLFEKDSTCILALEDVKYIYIELVSNYIFYNKIFKIIFPELKFEGTIIENKLKIEFDKNTFDIDNIDYYLYLGKDDKTEDIYTIEKDKIEDNYIYTFNNIEKYSYYYILAQYKEVKITSTITHINKKNIFTKSVIKNMSNVIIDTDNHIPEIPGCDQYEEPTYCPQENWYGCICDGIECYDDCGCDDDYYDCDIENEMDDDISW